MIDDISYHILKILQKKARIPNVEVARQVGLAPSAVLERIRKLEKQGIIEGYEVKLNPLFFKSSLIAFVRVSLRNSYPDSSVGEALAKIRGVQEVHYITGDDCYFIKLRVADTNELGRVLREEISSIEGVASTRTSVVLSTHKETWRIPLEARDKEKEDRPI